MKTIEFKVNGGIGRAWQTSNGKWAWATPDSEGSHEDSFEDAKRLAEISGIAGHKLCDLPDSEFEMGGTIDALAREAGYASGKAFANELGLWCAPAHEVMDLLLTEK